MQGTRVRSLVREDSTRFEATKPVSRKCRGHVPALSPCAPQPILGNKRSPCNEKPVHSSEDPAQTEVKKTNLGPVPPAQIPLRSPGQKTPLIWALTSGSICDLLALFLVKPFYLSGCRPRQNFHSEDMQSEKP